MNAVRWRRAASIAERVQAGSPTEVDHDLAERRFARWLTLPAFRAPGATTDAVLRPLGIDEAGLRDLLGETDASLDARALPEPEWWLRLQRWWSAGTEHIAAGEHAPEIDLMTAVVPAILGARSELADLLDRTELAPELRQALVRELCDSPPVDELSSVVTPAMVLELHLARERGELEGEDGSTRFREFVSSLRDPDRSLQLLASYPVLLRSLSERLSFWQDRSLEFAQRLRDDLPDISRRFWDGATATELTISFGAGDSHRRGRSVAVVTTDVGRVVYKPRSPRMDQAFDGVLRWFDSQDPLHDQIGADCLARHDHGWFEFVPAVPPSADQVQACVHRLGGLSALLHCLRATDMHHENVRISGDHPVATDLESLLHTERRYATREDTELLNVAYEALEQASSSVGILPQRVVAGRAGDIVGVDVSVFGPGDDQLSLVTVPQLVGAGTDDVRIEHGRGTMGAQQDGVTAPDALPLDPDTYFAGFQEAYDAVRRDGGAWTRTGGLLDGFAGSRTRFIPRPTMVYGKVLAESFHPDFLRDGLDRTLCLGKLLAGYWGRDHRDDMLASELSDLWRGDIPYFEMDVVDGRVVHESRPDGIDAFGDAPLDAARRFILDEVDDDGLALEAQLVRLSFASARFARQEAPAAASQRDRSPARSIRRRASTDPVDRRLTAATEVADLLVRSAIRRSGGVGWLSITAATPTDWVVAPTTMDTYAGLSGIAASLATVAEATGQSRFRELAELTLDQVAAYGPLIRLDDESVAKTRAAFSTGAYGHLTGMAVTLADGGRRFGRPELTATAQQAVLLFSELVDVDREFDVVGGNAGALLATLTLDELGAVPDARTLVQRMVAALLAGVRDQGDGVAWPPSDGGVPLVGFSHGTTGIALALARAARFLGDDSLLDVVSGALRYDRTGMTAGTADWRDLRDVPAGLVVPGADAEDVHMRAWCHGSPGAGLGRAELLALDAIPAENARLLDELRLARRSTAESLAHGGTGNLSLCHGDIGNVLALEAMLAVDLDRDQVTAETAATWDDICARGEDEGWRCGVPYGTHVPGLMMGLSGIAWGLAYSVRPDDELNVLTLRRTVATVPSASVGSR